MHAAREYVAWYMLVYEHFCVTFKLISYMHTRGDIRSLIFNFAGREKEIVGSAVVEILQPLCVFYCQFVMLLISMSFMNIDQ